MLGYDFKGLTDQRRLVNTMVEKSNMTPDNALDAVCNKMTRCVEVWEGDTLCGYFLILEDKGIRSVHGYNLTKGRGRHALRVALYLLKDEPRIYSGHQQANIAVNRLLKMMGFKDVAQINGVNVMERV